MNKYYIIAIITIILFTAIGNYAYLQLTTVTPPLLQPVATNTTSVSPGNTPTPVAIRPTQTTIPNTTPSNIYFPMTGYLTRTTNREYGTKITEKDADVLRCGSGFSGYHTGDDLEVFSNELNIDSPVYAIADGTVKRVGAVNGYGGLIIIEHSLNNQTVTAYYGHINIGKTTVKTGDRVRAGQQITVLGDDCTPQTGNERKHLHFSIYNRGSIDVRGYVDEQATLRNWVNPKRLLINLRAQDPST